MGNLKQSMTKEEWVDLEAGIKKNKKTEAKFQSDIRKALRKLGWLWVKMITTSRRGYPDVLIIKDGVHIHLEVKTKTGKLSEAQVIEHKKIRKKGGTVVIIDSIGDVVRVEGVYQELIDRSIF